MDRRIRYEEPTTAKYDWKNSDANLLSGHKVGNIDFFFPTRPSMSRIGAAMEVNYGYESITKIKQDFIKLLDPRNGYTEAVYFAHGLKPGFRVAVERGLEASLGQLNAYTSFALPVALHILVLEPRRRGAFTRDLWGADLSTTATLDGLAWSNFLLANTDLAYPSEAQDVANGTVHNTEESGVVSGDLYITRDEARVLCDSAMEDAGIPLRSKTARCMFEPTKDVRDRSNCAFGPTPLWDNCLRVVSHKVLKSEFMDWVDRLINSGRKFQKAGRASWRSQTEVG
jgi:hypothetical protein